MIRTFTAATTDSMTACMGAAGLCALLLWWQLIYPVVVAPVSTRRIHDRRADSISAAICQIVDPTRYGKYAVTVQTILRFPDHHLRATAQRVVVFDEDLCSLATNLLDTLRAASAIGITATHIGVLKRLAVIELAAADGVRTYVNPQIVWASTDMIRHEEGSVSMPGVTEEIERHARVRMSYQDLSGVEKVEEADGLLSVCLQHEVDQLDGIFWINRLSRLKRDRIVKRFDKTAAHTSARRLNSSNEALSRRRWASVLRLQPFVRG